MTRKLQLLIVLILGLFIASGLMAQSYSGGSGTELDPFKISTKADLKYLSETSTEWTKGSYFIQTVDLVFEAADFASGGDFYNDGTGFQPIGNHESKAFSGHYDGNDKTISNLWMDRSGESLWAGAGLFGYFGGGSTLKDLGLINVDFIGKWGAGAIASVDRNSTNPFTVENCYATGSVATTNSYAGGLFGSMQPNNASIIKNCWADVEVTGSPYYEAGGLVGFVNRGIISNSFSRGSVTGTRQLGGIVGEATALGDGASTTISKCYATGAISGGSSMGGICGSINTSVVTISDCLWDIQTTGQTKDHPSGSTIGGETTENMKLQATFTTYGWDFATTWAIDGTEALNDGYPYLSGIGENATPITLSAFSVKAKQGIVEITWTTASETENSYFLVYRDGDVIASVDGAGTTSESNDYVVVDDAVVPGVHEYALADVSYAGVEKVHETVSVEVGATVTAADFVLNKAYPNPFNPTTMITMDFAEASNAVVNIYNTNGALVENLHNGNLEAGSHELVWNASNITSGVYIVKMMAGNVMSSQKIVLMK